MFSSTDDVLLVPLLTYNQALRNQVDAVPDLATRATQSGFPLDDACLMRYLEMAELRLEWEDQSVLAMIQDTVAWRLENTVGTAPQPDPSFLVPAESGQIYINGQDREGRPIVIYSPTTEGACPGEVCMQYLVYTLERAVAIAESRGGTQYAFIVDMANMGTRPPLKTVKASFEIMGRHYPGRCGGILLVHGGSMIQMIWRFLEPMIPPKTRDKVTIVPEREEGAVLTAIIDPSQLEHRFKGGLMQYTYDARRYLAEIAAV